MLRFRNDADERVYLALRTELYVAAAQLSDPQLTSLIMRNFGKLEALVHMEGVRQGLALAALAKAGINIEGKRPSEALAMVYGDAETPLSRVEERWIRREDGSPVPPEEMPAWLDASEASFPPMTYAESMGIETPVPPVYQVSSKTAPVPMASPQTPSRDRTDAELQALFADEPREPVASSPEQLDHYRTELVAMKAAGINPQSWPELVLSLSLRLQEDAGFIDLALGSESGMLIVRQAGFDVSPASMAAMGLLGGFVGGHEIDVLSGDPDAPAPVPTEVMPPTVDDF